MERKNIYGVCSEVELLAKNILDELKDEFALIDEVCEYNSIKVLEAFRKNRLGENHFYMTTGYGYDDDGRDTLEKVYSTIFKTEDALVRPSLVSGTNALYVALSALTRPYDEILSPVGSPYDTLEKVIGIKETIGSLKENLVSFKKVDFIGEQIDYDGIKKAINDNTKLATIQRSKGYGDRPSISVEQIGELISFIKSIKKDIICLVDNCYGEFVDVIEPSEVGADVVVGSLIKNPGGFISLGGGYIAGKKELIERCACRLSAPGLGKEVGANLGVLRDNYRGLFVAPNVVANAIKTSVFAMNIYDRLGFKVEPLKRNKSDIIGAITLGSREGVMAFCKAIQHHSPVDSYLTPEPYAMPGYEDEVIMAAGAFVQGSSIELSADAPMREPYNVYLQGGVTFTHGKYAIIKTVQSLIDIGMIDKEKMKRKI